MRTPGANRARQEKNRTSTEPAPNAALSFCLQLL